MKDKGCFTCGAKVMLIHGRLPGEQRNRWILFDVEPEERYIVSLDATGAWTPMPVSTLKLHKCSPEVLAKIEAERQAEVEQRTAYMKRAKFEAYTVAACKPFEVECPKCGREAGKPCRDMRKGFDDRDTAHPHRERLTAGLAAQGREVVFDDEVQDYIIRERES